MQLIRARKGDRLIVHFSNRLPQSTTVHWHGVQVPIELHGVPGASQPPVETGGTFTYDFVVPDAGLFWYHPHVMSAAQVGFVLYGPLLVADPHDAVKVEDELVLVLSDIAVNDGGKMNPADSGAVLRAAGTRRQPRARQRPRPPEDDRARRRAAAVAHRQCGEEPLPPAPARRRQRFEWIDVYGGQMEYSLARYAIVLDPGERADVLVARKLDGQSLTLITISWITQKPAS